MRAGWGVLLMTAPLSRSPFDATLAEHGLGVLRAQRVTSLQVNVGKRCNLACNHCHVDAGPKRTETMTADTAERILALLEAAPEVHTLDLTGGAPELNPNFRRLVTAARAMGRRVIDRCNLTILFEPGMEDLAELLAANDVEIVASLPCHSAANVEKQRGRGVFDRSIEALRRLGALGYGDGVSGRILDLVYNPGGAFLPPAQAGLEARYRAELAAFGVRFDHLLTITNMPIRRFADALARAGKAEAYMRLLAESFNPATVPGLMCRSQVSVGWDGRLYDCDFNQVLELPVGGGPLTIWDIDRLEALEHRPVTTARHCYGCTAGSGSSCSGALA